MIIINLESRMIAEKLNQFEFILNWRIFKYEKF